MELSLKLKPRYVNEMRRVLDEVLLAHGVPDELLLRQRRERNEFTREELTLALAGQREMTFYFDQGRIASLHFPHQFKNSPLEFVKVGCNDAQRSSHVTQELNFVLTHIFNNELPTLEKVQRTLLSDFGQSPPRKRSILSTSFFNTFPIFQVPSPSFSREVYGGGKNRDATERFVRLSQKGQIEHKRFKVVYQWGNTLRLDLMEIHLPKESAYFLAVNGIITVSGTQSHEH
jgi:hypothetical protein